MGTQERYSPQEGRDHGTATEYEREILLLTKEIKKSIDVCLKKVEKEVERELSFAKEKLLQLEEKAIRAPNNEIHKKLDRILENQASKNSTKEPTRSYAQIAAQGIKLLPPTPYLPNRPPPPPERVTAILRTQISSPLRREGIHPHEITTEVKKLVQGTVLATPLQSGEIRILFNNAQSKTKALQLTEELDPIQARFKREAYPIEVLAVPTKYQIQHGKNADNSALIRAIEQANKSLNADIEITRINWIRGAKSTQKRKDGTEPKNASLIVYLSKETAQKRAVLSGFILENTQYTARVYNSNLLIPLYFKCNRWGHVQATCKGRETCGYCAEEHTTRECTKQDQLKCTNCKERGHPAWKKEACKVYKEQALRREELRLTLLAREIS